MKHVWVLLIYFSAALTSCKKEDKFLEAKPKDALVVPTTLQDYQLLLYNETVFNNGFAPGFGNVSSDEYYTTDANWASVLYAMDRNAYIYSKEIYESGDLFNDWNNPYKQIYYCNTVLEGIEKIKKGPADISAYYQIKSQALFFRANAFYNLAQVYALPYDSLTAKMNLGIPLRLSADMNVSVARATLEDTYKQVISDLEAALPIAPLTTPYPTQPSKVAVYALLARVYLGMGKYLKALEYSDITLSMNNVLTDYNTLTPTSTVLSTTYLKESIFQTCLVSHFLPLFSLGGTYVDSVLFSLYDVNDLRKTVLFRNNNGQILFRGSYAISSTLFYCGLATDEMYLIRSECQARIGNIVEALGDLNTLYRKRWKNGIPFVPITATSSMDALKKILIERRKELVFRGLRWTDLRRLNKEVALQETLRRKINGVFYTLPPNDPRYAMPLPPSEVELTGVPQNLR